MVMIDAKQYGPILGPLVQSPRRMVLGPGQADHAHRPALDALNIHQAFAHVTVTDLDMANACIAGLWLRFDFLDESHTCSQSIDTPTGSYWHGIMHRREPDYPNAKYWFAKVGRHPIFPQVIAAASDLARQVPDHSAITFLKNQSSWDPCAFIDLVEQCTRGSCPAFDLCCDVQAAEWAILFDHCYQQAIR